MSFPVPQHVRGLLRELSAKHLALPSDFRVLADVETVWRKCVSSPLADRVCPIVYRDGCLILRAESSTWASKAYHQHQTLLARLRQDPVFKGLRDIQVRVRPANRHPAPPPVTPRAISPFAARCLTDLAGHIGDMDLQASLRKLATRAPSEL